MDTSGKTTAVPVVLLYNIDESWDEVDKNEVLTSGDVISDGLRAQGHEVIVVQVRDLGFVDALENIDTATHVVMNLCEDIPGMPHSEGVAAQILEDMGFTYTGSVPEVLDLSGDKEAVKEFLIPRGIPTPAYQVFESDDIGDWNSYPCIVKPSNEHCSMGISSKSVAANAEELKAAIRASIESLHQPALVEEFIDGREFHVTVWGNEKPEMLPPAEMDFSAFSDFHDRLCTYEAKHKPGSEHYTKIETLLPAPLDDTLYKELERVVTETYTAFGCRDYARLDLRLRGTEFHVLDINPNADLSHEASMAAAAEIAGYDYGIFCSSIVMMAAARHPQYGS
ncbi:MAG: ATP-grasp domain-containing protein [Bacteroidota bacterium]